MKLLMLLFFICSSAFAQEWTSRGSAFNPDIGVNALFLYQHSNQENQINGFSFEEMELQFTADVDPYLRAQLILSVERQEEGQTYGVDPEEAYAQTINIRNTTFQFGKYYFNFGKHNLLHPHNFPMIDLPLINQRLFGEDGLNLPAFGVSYLFPTPWYFEILADYGQGKNEELFKDFERRNQFLSVHLKNLWDLNPDTTMEFGLTGGSAAEDIKLWQSDLTFRWRPMVGGKYHALEWQNEVMGRNNQDLWGFYSHLKYQFLERWWLTYRFDYADPEGDLIQRRNGLLLAFAPSEFSAFRLETDYNSTNRDTRVLLQMNLTIGAHPAHRY
jgi:hypothetical protein